MTATPIARTVKYATTVPDLADAWAFVMAWVDSCGADPHIEIRPYWRVNQDGPEARRFEVVVSGMQPVEEEQ